MKRHKHHFKIALALAVSAGLENLSGYLRDI